MGFNRKVLTVLKQGGSKGGGPLGPWPHLVLEAGPQSLDMISAGPTSVKNLTTRLLLSQ